MMIILLWAVISILIFTTVILFGEINRILDALALMETDLYNLRAERIIFRPLSPAHDDTMPNKTPEETSK